MLRELHISNLAVIEDARIELADGLNCFTGQTGAGKSLVIGAFEILLGLRKAGDLLRDGAEEGRVSGVFELADAELIRQVDAVADAGMGGDGPAEGPEQLLVTRKVFASGRTSVTVNGAPATLGMLQQIGELLVDVHGQHDHQFLLKPANQRLMLDRFAESDDLRQRYGDLHGRIRALRQRREALEASATLRKQQLELYEFQAGEIDEAEPTEGEYDELAARHRVMSNLEKIGREAGAAHAALHESDGAIIDRLQGVAAVLKDLGELDESLVPIADEVRGALAQLQDASFSLGRYASRLDLDPAELEEVESRLNTLNRLIQKYGPGRGGTLADVLDHRRTIGVEIDRLRGEGEDLASIDAQLEPMAGELAEVGAALSAKRREAAEKLCPLVIGQLAELGMADARFEVAIDTAEAPGESASGMDEIELLVAPNPGQAAKPLRRIASGGELSRIMLALKSILARSDRISVLVFDEVDANIGGRMGSVIGEKLRDLAAHHQVLCITHLPQIAAFASHHLRIAKAVHRGRTRTEVEPLDDSRRIDELAEMLAGKGHSATTRKQAEEMLANAAGANGKPKPKTPGRKRKTAKTTK